MTATVDDAVAELQRANAKLQRQLDECRTERDEALQRETATGEVLGVINASPGDLAPVFDAMLDKALHLCGAAFGIINIYDGEQFHAAAIRGAGAGLPALRKPGPHAAIGRIARGESLVHIPDMLADEAYQSLDPKRRAVVEREGVRSYIVVALRKDDLLLGTIGAYRQEVRPFSDKQIALLQNFAAQAVIAMENARLITETREALDQQTATAEVLGVINSSPGDLMPVFDAMLEKAVRLCEIDIGVLWNYDGEHFSAVAMHRVPESFGASVQLQQPIRAEPGGGTGFGRLKRGDRIVHVVDVVADETYRPDWRRRLGKESGIRTLLLVPLLKDENLVGVFAAYRQEVRPFTDKQIALLQNFAAQAVIAMENARLITETREALEQQTATAEVLSVINSSPGDLTPVFAAMLEKAMRLCEAAFGVLLTYNGEAFQAVAEHGIPPAFADFLRQPLRPMPGNSAFRVVNGENVVQIADLREDEATRLGDPARRAVIEIGGGRTQLMVALRKDNALIGMVVVYRQEVRLFSDKQIALLQNFAAQAVIAMENARLLGELRERTRDLQESLEYKTATSEVLKVISQSTFDLQPVLETLAETAARLCEAEMAFIVRREGEVYRTAVTVGFSPEAMADAPRYQAFLGGHLIAPGRGTLTGRVALEGRAVHIIDVASDPDYTMTEAITLGNVRTQLGVPLMREGSPIGVIILSRQRVEPFTEKQIELVTTFADQAVIAMENTRLFNELQDRTSDLEKSLEYQTATSDVLQVISRSDAELEHVLENLVETLTRLCQADQGYVFRRQGDRHYLVASFGVDPEFWEFMIANPFAPDRGTLSGRVALERRIVHIEDAASDPEYTWSEAQQRGNLRTGLGVPLLREDALLGIIVLYRSRVERFTDKQIALATTFADQAVIAIENARLLAELRGREAELRVTFDNMADGVVMFDEGLRLTAWNRNFQQMLDLPDALLAERPSYADYLRILAERGEFGKEDIEAELNRRLEDIGQELRLERTRPDGRVIEVRRNAVPDGGFVLIYSDITERKRSEAEIRAARDVAEATLRDLRAAQANLIQAEKMASLGQLTAGIAHEIKNPLNFVNNFADLSGELLKELQESAAPGWAALDEDKRAEIDETMVMLSGNLEKIGEHGRRADGIVKSMLEHSRGVSGERREVDFNNLIDEALNLAYHGARAQDREFNIGLEHDYAPMLKPIEVVPQEITRVFLNLFANGFYAAHKRAKETANGSFQPLLRVTTLDLGDEVEVRIRDNGIGIPADIKDKLFQPFFTTKPTGEGTGLGLSISYDIVAQQHRGTIEVESEEGAYTEFTIRLPR